MRWRDAVDMSRGGGVSQGGGVVSQGGIVVWGLGVVRRSVARGRRVAGRRRRGSGCSGVRCRLIWATDPTKMDWTNPATEKLLQRSQNIWSYL